LNNSFSQLSRALILFLHNTYSHARLNLRSSLAVHHLIMLCRGTFLPRLRADFQMETDRLQSAQLTYPLHSPLQEVGVLVRRLVQFANICGSILLLFTLAT